MASSKTLLVCGPQGSGKTALINRFTKDLWVDSPAPTVGLDENAGRVLLSPSSFGPKHVLSSLLPEQGLELKILEIGGKGGHLRGAPRGLPIDGLLLCYDLCDRSSFHNVAHLLLQHRADRHLRHQSASVVATSEALPDMAVVVCGTKADTAGTTRQQQVGMDEALDFAQKNGIAYSLTTSSKTGAGVAEAFQKLAAAILEAEEEAEADRIVAMRYPPVAQTWGLRVRGPMGEAMTSPRGERPLEPDAYSPAQRLVEVIDAEGVASVTRPLQACLDRGLLHRAVHVWVCDPRTGGLLLRRYSATAAKSAGRWGPSCHGEVLCYGSTGDVLTGPHTSEVSVNAAQRLVIEQLGVEFAPKDFEHWFSCTSRDGKNHEMLDIYAASLNGKLPSLHLGSGEEVEWVHFTDIFGVEGALSGRLFHIEETYRSAMVTRMKSYILQADRER